MGNSQSECMPSPFIPQEEIVKPVEIERIFDVWEKFQRVHEKHPKAANIAAREGMDVFTVGLKNHSSSSLYDMRIISKDGQKDWPAVRDAFLYEISCVNGLSSSLNTHQFVSSNSDYTFELFAAYEDSAGLYFISEYCPDSLQDLVLDDNLFNVHYSERHVSKIMRRVLLGVQHIHTREVAHLNLASLTPLALQRDVVYRPSSITMRTNVTTANPFKKVKTRAYQTELNRSHGVNISCSSETAQQSNMNAAAVSLQNMKRPMYAGDQKALNEDSIDHVLERIRLGSFQYARHLDRRIAHFITPLCLFRETQAPEVLKKRDVFLKARLNKTITSEAWHQMEAEICMFDHELLALDCWMLGELIFLLVTGHALPSSTGDTAVREMINKWSSLPPPKKWSTPVYIPSLDDEEQADMESVSEFKLVENASLLDLCEQLSRPLQHLLGQMLHEDAIKRYTIDQALGHPWIDLAVLAPTSELRQVHKRLEDYCLNRALEDEFITLLTEMSVSDCEIAVAAFFELKQNDLFTSLYGQDLCTILSKCSTDCIGAATRLQVAKLKERIEKCSNYQTKITISVGVFVCRFVEHTYPYVLAVKPVMLDSLMTRYKQFF